MSTLKLGPDLSPGVHRTRSGLATRWLARRLERAGWTVRVVDLAMATDKPAILGAFARDVTVPAWVGRNWDALDDALRDLSWWPAGPRGRVLIVRGSGRRSTGSEQDRVTLRSVLETAATRWATTATPLVVILRR